MPRHLTPDICVVGAGAAGLTVAAAAAAFGVEVVLIEKGEMGGDCLNTGCVPSKALIAAARFAHAPQESRPFGVELGPARVDFRRVHDHVREVIAGIAPHDSQERFEGLGVTVLRDHARFTGPDSVVAGETEIRARRFVIATGSRPAVPPIPGLDRVAVLTNETVFGLTELPARLAVIGGGPIGLELAQAFRRLGSEVTVLEAARALAREDPELAEVALAALRADGISVREGVSVRRVEPSGAGVTIAVQGATGETTLDATHLLVATGRQPVTEDLGLEAAGIAYGPRGIQVDRGLRTANRRVYAIGDVAGGPQFTHVAGWHGGLVVRSILFRLPIRADADKLPRATFTDPELAQVGLTEKEARENHGDSVRVLRSAYQHNDRARTERERAGLVKVVATKRGRLLGAGIVGRQAGEIANLWSLALSSGLSIRHMAGFVSPYPTLSDVGKRAAIGYYAESLTNPLLRRIIRLLRLFG